MCILVTIVVFAINGYDGRTEYFPQKVRSNSKVSARSLPETGDFAYDLALVAGYSIGYRFGSRDARQGLSEHAERYRDEAVRQGMAEMDHMLRQRAKPAFRRGIRDGFKLGYGDGYHNRPNRNP